MKEARLNNGVMMPAIGFGVFQIPVDETERVVGDALEVGYRMIDTAASYFNEEQVGNAIRQSGLKRKDIFVTTKLWVQDYEYDDALRAFDKSLKLLGLDYIDLYLLHKPYGNYYAAWRACERLYKEGRIRAIGVTRTPARPFPAQRSETCRQSVGNPPVLPAESRQQVPAVRRHTARGMGAFCRRAERHLEQFRAESHCRKAWTDSRSGCPPLAEPAQCGGHSQDGTQGADDRELFHF